MTGHWRLCRLIDESLRPFTDSHQEYTVCLTKESEKHFLIVLSQVIRQIQQWTREFDSDSVNGMVVKVSACDSNCSGGLKPHCNDHEIHNCLTKIIGDLILLLPVKSQYVQHVAGNVLVAISDYIAASGSSWHEFMQALCICLELAISNAAFPSMEYPTAKALVSDNDSTTVTVALKPKLKKANWSLAAGVIRVLRTIWKHVKRDMDDTLLELYLDSICSCLENVPWKSMDELHVGQNSEVPRIPDWDVFDTKAGQLESRSVFHATFVQFFCSLVNQSDSIEAAGGSLTKHPVIWEISNLIPRILAWCHGDEDQTSKCMPEYFKHKILILMIRLSFQIHLESSLLVSWLKLIHEYFEDLLLLPMTQLVSDRHTLEGSPFLLSVSEDRICSMSSSHLQRLAVFLFLRCSLSLVSLRDRTAEQCSYANLKSCANSDLNSGPECCSRKKGLSELYWWLHGHLPVEMFIGCEFYSERCTNFSLSFLKLFIHEDDILFEVLLQLFCVNFGCRKQVCQDRCTVQEMNDDMLFHVSNLLNPIKIFHLFMAEIHYDHQVLLDYLISKDTGARSAEYLLRSLRVTCDSWNLFLEFSAEGKVSNTRDIQKSSGKKRKVHGGDQKDVMCGSKEGRTNRLPFENAKNCLLSLKKSVQSLHQKKLFPYNPEVLLKRLTRFEELCVEQ